MSVTDPKRAIEYDPEIYDFVHRAQTADVAWYLARASVLGGPVLELGAGTGRTVLPLARAGLAVTALEQSPRMLAALRARIAAESPDVVARVRVVEADMARFAVSERFALIQIPYWGFQHNLERATQLACLSACHAHLRSGGVLAFDVFHPALRLMAQHEGTFEGLSRLRGAREDDDGGWVLTSESTRYRTVEQRLTTFVRHERFAPDGRQTSVHLQRLEFAYFYPGDLRDLLAAAGFTKVRIDGGFAGEPLSREGDELVVQAERP